MKSFASYWKDAGDFLASASAADFVEKARTAARDVADVASKVSDTIQAEYQRTFVDQDTEVFTVRPDLLVMEFPSFETIERLSTRLNREYPHRMMILNMSEKQYETAKFQGEVVDVAFRGLPSPPIELLMELCLSAHQWLASDTGNVLVVHCFKGYSRSALFMSCLLAFRGLAAHPVDALHEVCRQLNISDAEAIVPSQRRYLAYFQQCQQGLSPVDVCLRLLHVQLNGVPKFEAEGSVAFRPYIEIWSSGELLFSSLGDGEGTNLPNGFSATDSCVSFALPADTYIAGDVLIRIRHVSSDGSRITALRLAFHTGFVPDGFQLAKHELDCACSDERFSDNTFLDLIFQRPATEGVEELQPAPVFEKAREVSKRLAEVERKRQKEAAAVVPAVAGKAEQHEMDEFAELEEALRRGPTSAGLAASSSTASGAVVPATGGPLEEAPGKPEPAAKATAPVGNDLDDLFGDFELDAALGPGATGSAGKVASAPATATAAELPKEEVAPKVVPKTEAPAMAEAGAAGGRSKKNDDIFGDVDEFFAELDAT